MSVSRSPYSEQAEVRSWSSLSDGSGGNMEDNVESLVQDILNGGANDKSAKEQRLAMYFRNHNHSCTTDTYDQYSPCMVLRFLKLMDVHQFMSVIPLLSNLRPSHQEVAFSAFRDFVDIDENLKQNLVTDLAKYCLHDETESRLVFTVVSYVVESHAKRIIGHSHLGSFLRTLLEFPLTSGDVIGRAVVNSRVIADELEPSFLAGLGNEGRSLRWKFAVLKMLAIGLDANMFLLKMSFEAVDDLATNLQVYFQNVIKLPSESKRREYLIPLFTVLARCSAVLNRLIGRDGDIKLARFCLRVEIFLEVCPYTLSKHMDKSYSYSERVEFYIKDVLEEIQKDPTQKKK